MLPWIGAIVEVSLLNTATIKIVDYFKSKKKDVHNEIVLAKEEIINGIKEHAAAHTNKEGGEENADVSEL